MIEKQTVLDALEKERDYLINRGQLGAEHILVHHAIQVVEDLDEQEPIVRCKDCKHGYTGIDSNYVRCMRPYIGNGAESHSDDWFCADGESKLR